MPIFFDAKNPTTEQAERWESAKTQYDRILEQNAQRLFDSLTPEQRERKIAELHASGVTDPDDLKKHLYTRVSSPGNIRENGKSALFARLLDGKQPLPVPPPKFYGYPWYACIEEVGPFQVDVSGLLVTGEEIDSQVPTLGMSLLINDQRWILHAANAAARKLLGLQEKIVGVVGIEAGSGDEQSSHRPQSYTWPPDLLEAVRQAYAQAPEFTVSCGFNPAYVLRAAPVVTACRRYFANEVISAARQESILSRESSVLNPTNLGLHASIGTTLSRSASPLENLAASRVALQKDGKAAHLQQQVAIQEKLLGENLQQYVQDPGYADMVELHATGWYLFKT